MSPSDKHKLLIQNEYLTQSRKASGYTNYVTADSNSQQNSRTQVTEYNTQKSNQSTLTAGVGGVSSNQISGKILQVKNPSLGNTSSHLQSANQSPAATGAFSQISHKIDLSASLDLKNIQFKKIGNNKIQNKQTFLEQYRKSKQLDTGDIGGSLPVSQLMPPSMNEMDGRASPAKQTQMMINLSSP